VGSTGSGAESAHFHTCSLFSRLGSEFRISEPAHSTGVSQEHGHSEITTKEKYNNNNNNNNNKQQHFGKVVANSCKTAQRTAGPTTTYTQTERLSDTDTQIQIHLYRYRDIETQLQILVYRVTFMQRGVDRHVINLSPSNCR